jgi:oxaloacetate decarboxylase beta subunit
VSSQSFHCLKLINIDLCIGASDVSAVPIAVQVVQKFVSEHTKNEVNRLKEAMGPNVAGIIGSVVAAGVFLMLLLLQVTVGIF